MEKSSPFWEELKEWDQCLLMLGDAKVDEDGNVYDAKDGNVIYFDKDGEDREINGMYFAYFTYFSCSSNHLSSASVVYKAAIKADPPCYEALECLIESHMLISEEVLRVQYDKESTVEAKFKKLENETNGSVSGSSMISTLVNNTDLLAYKAELLEKDPFHLKCTLVHLAAAMELEFFWLMLCGCILIHGLRWVVTTIVSKSMVKLGGTLATSMDGSFSAAWIGFGNSFAAQEEGDQAMSAYRTAARLFPGLNLDIILFQVSFANSVHWNGVYANSQLQACGTVFHASFYAHLFIMNSEYGKAVRWFKKTLAHIPSALTEIWEPTVVNLAHAYRKLRKDREAISYYERALTLSTKSLSTYSGMAYTYHLQGNFSAAISYCHKALLLKPDDQFCTEMLNVALMDECQNGVDSKVEFC
ncbi:unnamed protein product [Arabis nemorensis]|uniref:Uncharacterized protein n=1 Tax=Arabis nemorensis TaxID=586526 RepID=A0A565B2A4_9BRAS|nr:unnamed protein product [Arabis nemorensis]